MKRLTVRECMSQQYVRVLADDHPDPHSQETVFAIFSSSTSSGVFQGLATNLDIALHPDWSFADFISHRQQTSVKTNTTVRQALAIMKKEKIDILAVLNSEGQLVGVVTQYDLLQARYLREHSLLVEARKHSQNLMHDNIEQQKYVQQAQVKINQMQRSDLLTGLPNLSQIRDKLKQLLEQNRLHSILGAVLLINLDNFKDINDSLGSHRGDLILQQVSNRVATNLRKEDILARKGGDEFIIVLNDLESADEAMFMAKRLLKVLAHPFSLDNDDIFMTASIGVCFYPGEEHDAETLLTNADIALSQAKEVGKNNYQVFMQKMGERIQNLQKMEKCLRHALQKKELSICYQPQVDIQSNHIVGIEALLRWQSPELGLILPSHFIPLAEKTGLIKRIGDWTLHSACEQAMLWQQQKKGLRISVNLSPRQFQEVDSHSKPWLITSIKTILQETKLPPELLEVEITENLIMKNYVAALFTLKELKNLGVRISCDDFGTGYSSLNYLKQFPIDSIKIDKYFVNDIAHDFVDVAIVRAIIVMAQQLNIEVVAEGVENKEQLDMLANLGCNIVQGYYFSPPLTSEATTAILQTGV